MAKGPRELIKRHLDQAITHVETVQDYLVRNGEMNRELHPDITKQYEVAYAYFEEGKNLLISFRTTY